MSLAEDIPLRSNGEDILAAWFNAMRAAIIEFAGGAEAISQTRIAGLASQTGTNVAGLIFDKTLTRRASIEYTVVTPTKVESGTYVFLFDGTNWTSYGGSVEGVNSGVILDVNASTGQATYDSGSETFDLDFTAETFNL